MATCDFRGCPFPAVIEKMDVNAWRPVCQQHREFLDMEAGRFDAPILETFVSSTVKPFQPIVSSDSGFTLDSDLRLTGGKFFNPTKKLPSKRRLRDSLSGAFGRRQRNRVRENLQILGISYVPNRPPTFYHLRRKRTVEKAMRQVCKKYSYGRRGKYLVDASTVRRHREEIAEAVSRALSAAHYENRNRCSLISRALKPQRSPSCHPQHKHYAKGLCWPCYRRTLPRKAR